MSGSGRRAGGLVADSVRSGLVAGGLLLLVDVAQVAWRVPGGLRWTHVAWLAAMYLVPALVAAGVLTAVLRDPGRVRAVLVAGGGACLAVDVGLRQLTPLSPWHPAVVTAVVVVAIAALVVLPRSLRRIPAWVVGVWLAGLGAATAVAVDPGNATPTDTPRAPRAARPNVVLVVIDTLRADHLGCYGYARPTSPHLDAFAAESVLFTRAFAQSSWTKPAMASLLTSRYPSAHQTNAEAARIPDTETLLTERLRAEGYATAVFSGNPWISPPYGFDRGVDHFFTVYDEQLARTTLAMRGLKRLWRRAYERMKNLVQAEPSTTARDEIVADATFRWLDATGGRPFYAHLHLMSPHHPYDPPPPYDRFVPDRSVTPVTVYPRKSYVFFDSGEPLSPAQRADMIARYDGDVLFADMVFGRVVDGLRTRGLLDDTIVIVVSDHGEEFYEHDNWGHGQSIYNELIHVPLLIRHPRAFRGGTRVAQTVMQVDLVPTVLELVGAPPASDVAGTSLVAMAHGATPVRAPQAYSELLYVYGAARGVVDGERKLIDTVLGTDVRRELYDLRTDFGEQHDLASREPAVADHLGTEIAALREASAARGSTATDAPADDASRERLKALGYLE